MSRARIDLGGSSSKSAPSSKSSGAGVDKAKFIKLGVAVAVLVLAGGYIAWDQGMFESRPTGTADAGTPAPAATENPAPAQPATADAGSDRHYGDDSAAAAAPPPKRAERRGGGYVNPDAPKDPE